MSRHFRFTFLMYPCKEDPRKVVAHCLELDLVAVGDTRPKAIELLKELIEDTLEAAIADDTLAQVFRPAPQKYWAMYATSTRYTPPRRVIKKHIRSRPVRGVSYATAGAR